MADVKDEVVDALVDKLLESHPWPWHTERDWGYEVLDAKGRRIALFRTGEMAQTAVKMASDRVDWSNQLADDLRRDLDLMET